MADLVRPEQKVTYFKMSKESEGSFRDLMKNIMSAELKLHHQR